MASETRAGLKDWSTLHEPFGEKLFATQDKSSWGRYKFTDEQLDAYWRDGYLSNITVLTPEQCDLILQDYKYFIDPSEQHPGMDLLYEFHSNQTGDPDNALMHCLGHWRLTELFHDLVFHPAVVVPCSQLLVPKETRPVRFFHDQLFAKPAYHGGNVACVLTEDELAGFRPTPSLLKKGEASFHHPLSVHGSYPNRSGNPRRAAVLNYFADGVRFIPDGTQDNPHNPLCPRLKDQPDSLRPASMQSGDIMQGQFFPLVYDPAWTN